MPELPAGDIRPGIIAQLRTRPTQAAALDWLEAEARADERQRIRQLAEQLHAEGRLTVAPFNALLAQLLGDSDA